MVDKRIIVSVRNVVEVLDADDIGDGLRVLQLGRRDVAQTDMADYSLALEFDEYRQRFGS